MDGEAVSARMFRDRLTGRTPRSERGDRGSTPCPGSMGRIAESSAKQPHRGGRHGKWERWFEGSTPSRSTHSRASSSGGAAPAPARRRRATKMPCAMPGSTQLRRVTVAQPAELPPLKRRVAGSTPAGATLGRTATGAVSRLENGCASGPWGFDSLSFRSRRHGPSSFRCGRVGKTRDC